MLNKFKTLVLFFSSIFLSFYILEIILYINYTYENISIKQIREYEKKNNIKYDKRSLFDIYQDLKEKNPNYTLTFSPKAYLRKEMSGGAIIGESFFTLGGISNSLTIHCKENGYFSIFNSDRYGFNNPDEEWDKKEIDFFLVGDSFVFGSCVNRPHDIGSVLRNLEQDKKTVLNLSYDGHGPLMQLASIKEYSKGLKIKNILWFYFEGNDLSDLSLELKSNSFSRYYNDLKFTQNLIFKQNLIDQSVGELVFRIPKQKYIHRVDDKKKFIKLQNVRTTVRRIFIKKEEFSKFPLKEFKQTLKLAKDIAYEKNANLYFVYLPNLKRYKINQKHESEDAVKNLIEELEIPMINIAKRVFDNHKNPISLFPFNGRMGHYNEGGYKLVGKSVYEFIKKRDLQ